MSEGTHHRHIDAAGLLLAACLLLWGVCLLTSALLTSRAAALSYSEGSYGTCQYNTCSISIATNGAVTLSMMQSTQYPTLCSVGSDTVTVSTRSSTGYMVSISVPASDTHLEGVNYSGMIPASSGTAASPVLLAANTWGYRVDGGAFGAGPTTSLAGGSVPSLTFAGVPAFATPSQLTTSGNPATNETTNVWYGVCVDTDALMADTYENDLVYTASVN